MRNVIKFRVWDIEEQQMIYNAERNYDFGDVLDSDNYIVMQYIGVTTSKGLLIYSDDTIDVNGKLYLILLDDFIHGVRCMDLKTNITNGFTQTIKNDLDFKVIGNIHQNKELILNGKIFR